ncbi:MULTISPECIES: respiratory nitrate reductase subunit gamma [unclassified Streptomyces]|uniref:respiratory nitrate reductase subunit gamma n=1 Tax=unclassified Streptomyces TaxID=2593676 RepID=UPI000F6C0674|nr:MULTISPECIES: respiratory nitrate reductase subunit gamma [unclassified Streptomyces]AZM64068.1 respiratory nitrate reductase subunit gamma [Streptomyces sp. WAC 01438]RSM88158.1 respiratory nitrate reductase subunit gamma [Streptomyces sp. WAC 01420]
MTASPQHVTLAVESGTGGILLWVVLPYISLAVFVLGHIWRYRYDKFGWTTRSSQLYERRLLRIGSPLFHFGILLVLIGHIGGLVVPESWTEAVGISEHTYHVLAVALGTAAGICTLGGLAILIYRRRTVGPVFSATTVNDKAMYLSLTVTIVLGLAATVAANLVGGGYNYRETISPWFRSIFYLQPDPDLMTGIPVLFQLHALSALLLFAAWPFTRLVHMLTAPLGYLTRPYIVYRSRDARLGTRAPHRGWERIR